MNTIESQAKYYADRIGQSSDGVIHFYPMGKTMNATANRFRLMVLRHLVGDRLDRYHSPSMAKELTTLQARAIERGYSIVDYQPLIEETTI